MFDKQYSDKCLILWLSVATQLSVNLTFTWIQFNFFWWTDEQMFLPIWIDEIGKNQDKSISETSVSSISTDLSIQSISIKSDLPIFIDLLIEKSTPTFIDWLLRAYAINQIQMTSQETCASNCLPLVGTFRSPALDLLCTFNRELLLVITNHFWATHVNRNWTLFRFDKHWHFQICIAKCLYSYKKTICEKSLFTNAKTPLPVSLGFVKAQNPQRPTNHDLWPYCYSLVSVI